MCQKHLNAIKLPTMSAEQRRNTVALRIPANRVTHSIRCDVIKENINKTQRKEIKKAIQYHITCFVIILHIPSAYQNQITSLKNKTTQRSGRPPLTPLPPKIGN